MRCGTTTYSAKAPARRKSPQETPITCRLLHKLISPWRQNSHCPQYTVESNVTRSPGLNLLTPAPTAATIPAASCPMTIGGIRLPEVPSYPCTSLPQIAHG